MDHEQIDQRNLVSRYLMGKLPADESVSFEEHFVDCPQCIAALETSRDFLRDFRLLAAEQAAPSDASRPQRAWPQTVRLVFPKPMAWAVAGLLVVLFVVLLFALNRTRRLRDELNQTQSLAEQWQRRYEDERQSAAIIDRQRQQADEQYAEQLRALEARLKPEQPRDAALTAPPAGRLAEGDLPLFVLASVRGREESLNRIPLPRAAEIFALSIPLEGEPPTDTYRITILNDRKQTIWRSGQLRRGAQDMLSIWLKPALFAQGRYILLVESDNQAGAGHVVGNYPLQIIKKP